MKKYLYTLFLALLAGGCTDNGFLFRTGGYEAGDPKGMYIIGEPYAVKGTLYTPKEDFSYVETGMAAWYTPKAISSNGESFAATDGLTARHKTLPLPSLVRITNLENGNTAIVRVNDRGPYVNNRLIDVSEKAAKALEFPATGTVMVKVEVLAEQSRRLKAELDKEGLVAPVDWGTGEQVIPEESSSDIVYQPTSDIAPRAIYGAQGEGNAVAEKTVSGAAVAPGAADSDIALAPEMTAVLSTKLAPLSSEDAAGEETKEEAPVVAPVGPAWFVQIGAFGVEANARRLEAAFDSRFPVVVAQKTKGGSLLHLVRVGPFTMREKALECLDKLKKEGYADAKVILEK